MQVIFLYGPPAAGKHTIGSLVSEKTGIPLFHNHLTVDLATSLFEFATPGFIALREQVWMAAFSSAADVGQSFIFTFNPENSVDPGLIERLEAEVTKRGGEIIYVELLCSDEAVLDRIDNESRKQFGKLVDKGLYQDLKTGGTFDFPPLPEPMIQIDTEKLLPDESADKIRTFLLP